MIIGQELNKILISQLKELKIEIPSISLMDIGCSGGIHPAWRDWEDKLSAYAIDPLTLEIERLRKLENMNVKYFNYFLGFPDLFLEEGSAIDLKSNYQIKRTAAWEACNVMEYKSSGFFSKLFSGFDKKEMDLMEIKNYFCSSPKSPSDSTYRGEDKNNDPFFTYYKKRFASNVESVVTDKKITVDEICLQEKINDIDFIKIDTDGYELEILQGAKNLLANGQILGVEVECQFHGPAKGFSGNFADIDKFMRSNGFSLYKLEPQKYSRSCLPSPFLYDIPAQNISGQVQWSDALYLRDLADMDYEKKHQFNISDKKILNLALIFCLYGLYDCSCEVLLKRMLNEDNKNKMEIIFNILCEKITGSKNYKTYISKFLKNPLNKN